MKVKKCPTRKNCFDYRDNNCDNCNFGNELTKLHKRIDRLKKQNETLTIQRNAWALTAKALAPEWISVDERLPENDYGKHWKERQYYLVMTEPSGLMRVAHYGYKEYGWWIDSHNTVIDRFDKVTHWMPLPEPPKMKGGAE